MLWSKQFLEKIFYKSTNCLEFKNVADYMIKNHSNILETHPNEVDEFTITMARTMKMGSLISKGKYITIGIGLGIAGVYVYNRVKNVSKKEEA